MRRGGARWFGLAAATILVAGCVAAPAAPGAPSTPLPTLLTVSDSTVAVEKCHFQDCYEPTVAADVAGRLFAADARTSAIGVSLDGGATWTQRPQPPAKTPNTVQRDALVQVSPAGRLYYSALVTVSPLDAGLSAVPVGIQVAWSDDGARTWAGNVQLSVADGDFGTAVPDRQWLGFSQDGLVYLSFGRPDSIWLSRSDDGGATWSAWTQVIREREHAGGASGPPVVDSAGRVFIPACDGQSKPDFSRDTLVFVSQDDGATFERRTIALDCGQFPMLAAGPDDALVLAAVSCVGCPMRVAGSTDHGATFAEAEIWADQADASPWPIALSAGAAMVAWFALDGGVELRLSSREPGGAISTVAAATPDGAGSPRFAARTDFASAALMPDGRVALVWVDGNQIKAAVVSGST